MPDSELDQKVNIKIAKLRDSAITSSRNLIHLMRIEGLLLFPLLLLISFRMRLIASNSNTPRGRNPRNELLVWLDELPMYRARPKGGPQVA